MWLSMYPAKPTMYTVRDVKEVEKRGRKRNRKEGIRRERSRVVSRDIEMK